MKEYACVVSKVERRRALSKCKASYYVEKMRWHSPVKSHLALAITCQVAFGVGIYLSSRTCADIGLSCRNWRWHIFVKSQYEFEWRCVGMECQVTSSVDVCRQVALALVVIAKSLCSGVGVLASSRQLLQVWCIYLAVSWLQKDQLLPSGRLKTLM